MEPNVAKQVLDATMDRLEEGEIRLRPEDVTTVREALNVPQDYDDISGGFRVRSYDSVPIVEDPSAAPLLPE